MLKHVLAIVATLASPLPALAQEGLQSRVVAELAKAPAGTRFGLLVVDDRGREIVAVNPDMRFVPASNTKLFTTAAAFTMLGDLTLPDTKGGAAVRIDGRDVVLIGNGDARLSSADDCKVDCLSELVAAVAAKTKVVGNIVGDDTLFPDERWSPGMSWNNIPTRSGTGISALTLDDNELVVTVTPDGKAALPAYYSVDNRISVVPGAKSDIGFDRAPNGFVLRLTGTIGRDAKPAVLRVGIDDPARYAAWRFAEMLRAKGVRITGRIDVRHRPLTDADDAVKRNGAPAARPPAVPVLARLIPPPLVEDIRVTNKLSQNLHAELLLRRVSLAVGSGSIADGQSVIRGMMAAAGAPRASFDFSDGSGMSNYDRVAPRGSIALLRWIGTQPWSALWYDSLPVGGVDGTLARRFGGTILDRKLFAKTGSLSATAALSGTFITRTGKTFTFSAYANDVPDGTSATKAMDAALVLIATES